MLFELTIYSDRDKIQLMMKKFFNNNKYILTVLLLVLILRVPNWFEPYWYGDEGITMTMGQVWRNGGVIYRDLHDNKPPMLYLLAALTYNQFFFKLLLTVWSLATVYLFWKLLNLNFFKSIKLWIKKIGIVIFSLWITLPWWEGNVINGEIFQIGPAIWGMAIILDQVENKYLQNKASQKKLFGAGFLFSICFLFKHPGLMDWLAATCIPIFLFINFKINEFKRYIFWMIPLVFGFLLPILAFITYFYINDALFDFISSVFGGNLNYLSTWQPQASWGSRSAYGGSLNERGIVLISLIFGVFLVRKKISVIQLVSVIWFLFALFGSTMSGRPYVHYQIQIIPPLVLLIISSLKINWRNLFIGLIGLLLWLLAWHRIDYQPYPNWNYYHNYINYSLGLIDKNQYFNNFDPQATEIHSLSNWLKNKTEFKDKIFIWGDYPMVYALTDRNPAGRYTSAYHIIDFDKKYETIKKLQKEKPTYIIWAANEKREFIELKNLVKYNYRLIEVPGVSSRVYKRIL